MIRSSQPRWLLALASAALLSLPAAVSSQQQAASQAPLPATHMRALPVEPGKAPKMTVEERTAAAHIFELRFSDGDEILSGLNELVAKHRIATGHIAGVGGAAPGALLGWGDPDIGGFRKIETDARTEIASLLGEITLRNGEPFVHVHMILSSADGSTKAGHLIAARAAPLAEITVIATSFAER
jgi:predicted DNA-binding protein with PD1-like motif